MTRNAQTMHGKRGTRTTAEREPKKKERLGVGGRGGGQRAGAQTGKAVHQRAIKETEAGKSQKETNNQSRLKHVVGIQIDLSSFACFQSSSRIGLRHGPSGIGIGIGFGYTPPPCRRCHTRPDSILNSIDRWRPSFINYATESITPCFDLDKTRCKNAGTCAHTEPLRPLLWLK